MDASRLLRFDVAAVFRELSEIRERSSTNRIPRGERFDSVVDKFLCESRRDGELGQISLARYRYAFASDLLSVRYAASFARCRNHFVAEWPSYFGFLLGRSVHREIDLPFHGPFLRSISPRGKIYRRLKNLDETGENSTGIAVNLPVDENSGGIIIRCTNKQFDSFS